MTRHLTLIASAPSLARRCGSALAACLLIAATTGGSASPRPGLAASLEAASMDAGMQTVFGWREGRCDNQDIPDAPARAFRDAAGTVRLFATHFINRALIGPGLGSVAPDCRVAFQGDRSDDPAAFNDRIWLTAFHTTDGRTVHALGHAEYHGHLRPATCASGRYMDCWWNAIVQAVSEDGGQSFRRVDGPTHGLVAALPYRYAGAAGHPSGYFSPSNIIERDGTAYAFIFASATRAQQRGACLLQTRAIADPAAWRAWDGRAFAARFIDPYAATEGMLPEEHVCAPVAGIPSTLTSLVIRKDGSYFGLFAASRPASPGGPKVTGVYAIASTDLLHWSRPQLLVALPMMFDFPCEAEAAYAYPSLLDETSASRTFATVGDRPYLYLTRFNVRGCRLTMDRDLVRFRVHLADPADTVLPAPGR